MKKEIVFSFLLALLSIGFFSCQKDDLGNSGPSTLDVKIEALNKSYTLPVNGSANKSAQVVTTSIEWDSAHLVISHIKFEAELKSLVTQRDSIEVSYKWTGPELADLLNPDISFGSFLLQPGFYDEIEISVKGEKEDAKDIPVFYLHGTYTGSTATLPVEVRITKDITFKTEKDSVQVTEDNIEIISYIKLYLDELMEKVQPADLDNAKLSNGVIVISSESNSEMYWIIMSNLVKDQHCYHEHKDKKKDKHKDKKKKHKKHHNH